MGRMNKVAVIGSGQVGQVLADGFLKHGYEVRRGTREPSKLAGWQANAGGSASVGTFAEAAAFGDVVVLAVKGSVAEAAIDLCEGELAGKTVLDATNPLKDVPPTNGVLAFFTALDDSLMERLQRRAPTARFVKAFSCVGSGVMVNPDFGGTKPSMFICGNSSDAKQEARVLLDKLGWQTEDMGGVEAARAIEPLCILWCIPGFLQNSWSHAFHLLKKPA
jgi:8-hydroxy-5-deazaflavin:NADPH oxidoreductase